MIPLSRPAARLVEGVLEDIAVHPRYRGGVTVDDDGLSHPWGAATSGMERMGQPIGTKEDIHKLRRELKKVGMDLSFDDVDALLSEAIWHGRVIARSERKERGDKQYGDEAERAREKRRRRIMRLREAELCIICGRNPVEPPRSTCTLCSLQRKRLTVTQREM